MHIPYDTLFRFVGRNHSMSSKGPIILPNKSFIGIDPFAIFCLFWTKQLLLFNSRLLRILAKYTTLNLVTWEISNTYIRFWFQFKVHIEDRASNFFQGMHIYIHKNVLFAQIPYCEFSYDPLPRDKYLY